MGRRDDGMNRQELAVDVSCMASISSFESHGCQFGSVFKISPGL